MRVANYYRVSTKLQEKRFSLPAQKEELRNYADKENWTIINEFADVESGGKLKKDGLNGLLDLVEEGAIDVVLVVDQDRLSRLDTVAWEYLKSTLRDNKVKIAEPGNVIDLDNEDDEFISDIKNLIARREKKSIVKRMMRGKRQRLREGKGWGMPPFEYKYNRQTETYEAKEEWKWVIPFIDDLYLNKQLGMESISTKLNEICKTPSGGVWNAHLIYTRITSKAYHGISEKAFSNQEVISIPGIYEPLRTEETYNKIQEERLKRVKQYSVAGRKNPKIVHMLKRTYLTCGECGRKMLVVNHGWANKPRFYIKHGRKKSIKTGELCDISINTTRVDNNIIKALKEVMTSEELAKKYINIDYDENDIFELKKDVKASEKTAMTTQASLDRLLDLYLSGNIKKDVYLKKEQELKNKLEVQNANLGRLKRKLDATESKKLTYESLYQYMGVVQNIENELVALEKAQLMGTLFPSGVVFEDKLVLTTEILDNIPIEITIPIDPDPHTWHHTKNNKNHR